MDRNNSMTKNNQKQNMKSNTQRQHPIAALGVAVHAVHRGSDIHLKRGETEVTVNVPDEEDENKESLD